MAWICSFLQWQCVKEIQKLFDRPTVLFDFITPLITKKSIQVTNGLEGKNRHRNISEALGHGVCQQIFPQFVQVKISPYFRKILLYFHEIFHWF